MFEFNYADLLSLQGGGFITLQKLYNFWYKFYLFLSKSFIHCQSMGVSGKQIMNTIMQQGPTDALRVGELQSLLANMGFYCGRIDNILGPKTEAAIIAFQKAQGLNPDWVIEALKSRSFSNIKVVIRLLMVQCELINPHSALSTGFSQDRSHTDKMLIKSAA